MVKIDIDMPKNCYKCGRYELIEDDNVFVCLLDNHGMHDIWESSIDSGCPLIIDNFDDKLNKLKLEFEKANKADDRYAAMEEAEEFMDGEMIYNSGVARGRYLGLKKALEIVEEMTAPKNIENVSKELIDKLEEIKSSESAWEILLKDPKGIRCT